MSRKKRSAGHLVRRGNPAEPCPSCGIRVARSRQAEHFRDPACLVAETLGWLREAGWERVPGGSLQLLADALGVPSSATVGARVGAPGLLLWAPTRVDVRRTDSARVVTHGWWAPAVAVEAVGLLCGLGGGALSSAVRRAAVRRAWLDQEWAEAVRAAKALGGATAARALARLLDDRPKRAPRAQASAG